MGSESRGVTPNLFVGVDPGLHGAIAFYDINTGDLDIHDMPTFSVTSNGKKKTRLDLYQLGTLMDYRRNSIIKAAVEEVGAMPGQGVTSMFAFGFAAGAVQSCIASNLIPMELVRPATWKRQMGLTSDKDASRRKASMIFPRHAAKWARAKDDGRAEAALLAYWLADKESRIRP